MYGSLSEDDRLFSYLACVPIISTVQFVTRALVAHAEGMGGFPIYV